MEVEIIESLMNEYFCWILPFSSGYLLSTLRVYIKEPLFKAKIFVYIVMINLEKKLRLQN